MQISVMLSSLGLPFEAALDKVVELEIPAVQITFSAEDELAAHHRIAQAVRERGLEISAVLADVGDLGDAEHSRSRIDAAKSWLDVVAEVGNGILQSHIGVMPHTASGPRWETFVANTAEIAAHGEKVGACLALETGPEPPRVVEKLLRTVNSSGLRVNYDPANLIIWPDMLPRFAELVEHSGVPLRSYSRAEAESEFEPVEGVKRLGEFIIHTHAKDAIAHGKWSDVPLGTGWIDWQRYLTLLQEAGYDGYLTIEREAGEDAAGDCDRAARFLREQLQQLNA